MKYMNNMNRIHKKCLIDELFKVTVESVYEIDKQYEGQQYWPFHPAILESNVAPILFKELLRLFRNLKDKGYTLTDIAHFLKNPALISNYQCLWLNKINTLNLEEKYELMNDFIKLLVILRNGEPFCEKGRNLVWPKRKCEYIIRRYQEKFISDENAKAFLPKIESLLVLYAEALYFYRVDFSRMFHGPYSLNHKIIFVKEYRNLKPKRVWEVSSEFPFSHYQEIGIYKKTDITVKFLGHTLSNPPFPQTLEKFMVKVDGRIIYNLEEMEKLYEKSKKITSKLVQLISSKINDMDFLIQKGIKAFFFTISPLYDILGEDWEKAIPSNIQLQKVQPPPWGDWSKEDIISFLLDKIDFRGEKK